MRKTIALAIRPEAAFALVLGAGKMRGPFDMSNEGLLSVRGLTKRFAGTLALDGLDLDICAGEVHALLGENGAGKSTFIKVLAGVYPPDAGEIDLEGSAVEFRRGVPDGVAFLHQDLALVEWMSVAENIALAAGYPRMSAALASRGRVVHLEMSEFRKMDGGLSCLSLRF